MATKGPQHTFTSRTGRTILGWLNKPYAGTVVAVGVGLVALVLLTAGFVRSAALLFSERVTFCLR